MWLLRANDDWRTLVYMSCRCIAQNGASDLYGATRASCSWKIGIYCHSLFTYSWIVIFSEYHETTTYTNFFPPSIICSGWRYNCDLINMFILFFFGDETHLNREIDSNSKYLSGLFGYLLKRGLTGILSPFELSLWSRTSWLN